MFFLKHLNEYTRQRNDIRDIEGYHKNGVFEELCHLVEHKGDSSVQPRSYWTLWTLYTAAGMQREGCRIIEKLSSYRNHYEVYSMMIGRYPGAWLERYCRFWKESIAYEREYEQWKEELRIDIALGRLVTDYLGTLSMLYVMDKVDAKRLTDEQKELLHGMLRRGSVDIGLKRRLIAQDMGSGVLAALASFGESRFASRDAFFYSILERWRRLRLV